jgi:hypothetical protein
MKKFSIFTTAMIAVLALSATAAMAQTTTAKPPPTYEQVIVNTWKSLHNKILAMAKDTVYPDSKLGWKPHPDSRSVIDELRHVTIGLEMTTARAKGENYDFAAKEKEFSTRPQTRAAVVAEMEKAIAESYAVLDAPGAKPLPGLIGWLDHQGEHYGKLVTSYRVNGIVPPISRPKS